MKRSSLAFAAVLALGVAACAPKVQLTAQLTGGNEVPPTTSRGNGVFSGVLNPSTGEMSYTMTYAGLTGPATAAHLHGPAAPGQNAGVVVPFTVTPSPISGTATLTGQGVTDILAGRWYANIHTSQFPNGEIRGQVTH